MRISGRIIIAVILTIVLLAIARNLSMREPQDVVVPLNGVIANHRTVTESKPGFRPPIVVEIEAADSSAIEGTLYYHYLKGTELAIPMAKVGTELEANLPGGEIGQRLRYRVELTSDGKLLGTLPPVGQPGYLVKYKGVVSSAVLIAHILFMFVSVFLAFVAFFYGIDLLRDKNRSQAAVILVLLVLLTSFAGGILIGIEVTRQTFGEGFGGWPFGKDITDSKTEALLLCWLVTLVLGSRAIVGKEPFISRRALGTLIMLSFVVTVLAFLIPHSI